jgi:hypothetical protein
VVFIIYIKATVVMVPGARLVHSSPRTQFQIGRGMMEDGRHILHPESVLNPPDNDCGHISSGEPA